MPIEDYGLFEIRRDAAVSRAVGAEGVHAEVMPPFLVE
jgi:hypothetical protein